MQVYLPSDPFILYSNFCLPGTNSMLQQLQGGARVHVPLEVQSTACEKRLYKIRKS